MADAAEHKHPNYVLIWVYLAVLTVVEVVVAMLHFLPRTALILLLVGLAVWKAALVGAYFMHLKFEPRKLLWMVLSPLPLAAILILYVMKERFK